MPRQDFSSDARAWFSRDATAWFSNDSMVWSPATPGLDGRTTDGGAVCASDGNLRKMTLSDYTREIFFFAWKVDSELDGRDHTRRRAADPGDRGI
jgi:hypothetical protein